VETLSYLGHTIRRWRVGQSTFLALPELGARLMNWNLTLGDGSVRDVIYWPELKSLDDFHRIRGGNPILFPFSARTFDRGEQGFWRADDGIRRPMPQHGFARQGAFKTVRCDARGFAAQFVPSDEARAGYPYDYEFTVTYLFEPLGLSCEFQLKNLGQEPLPWCPGHHFYFTVPWSEGSVRADYLIRLSAAKRWKQDAAGQLVPAPALATDESLGNPALIDTIHTGLRSREVVFGEKGRPGDVVVRLGRTKVPPAGAAFVTWTAGDDAPFYCVEPWMGPPNAPEHKTGLQFVAPRETGSFTVSVAVK
jgi:galactose mutarotase-like enzyme